MNERTENDLQVFELENGDWRVEHFDGDGGCYVFEPLEPSPHTPIFAIWRSPKRIHKSCHPFHRLVLAGFRLSGRIWLEAKWPVFEVPQWAGLDPQF